MSGFGIVTTFGAIDGFTIALQPFPHCFQSFDTLVLNSTVSTWPDVQQQVTVKLTATDQGFNNILRRFKVPVVDIVSPALIDSHAGL